jgi:hypothetical protein
MRDQATARSVLVIDPAHRGFGYTIFEGPQDLIDWGVRHVQGAKNKTSLSAAGEPISHYGPQILLLEDTAAKGCRRGRRVRDLMEALELYARSRGLTVRKISQDRVKRTFSPLGVRNKDQMARFIAARFPELAHHVPPERKPSMSEDRRMAIFDAAAFAIVSYGLSNTPPNSITTRLSQHRVIELPLVAGSSGGQARASRSGQC